MKLKTGARTPSADEIHRQVERITRSDQFRGSASLRRLIRFITDETLSGNPEHLRETVIGIRVFDRGEQFDGKTDNVVRVQAHRLRRRLREYYETGGRHDDVVIEIPKGHYVPRFGKGAKARRRVVGSGSAESAGGNPLDGAFQLRPWLLAAVAFAAGIAFGAVGHSLLNAG